MQTLFAHRSLHEKINEFYGFFSEHIAVRCLAKDIDRLLVHYSFPVKHRVTIRTSNPIERLFVQVRRRTRPIGSFTNTKSLNRNAYGIFWIINRMWEDTCLKVLRTIPDATAALARRTALSNTCPGSRRLSGTTSTSSFRESRDDPQEARYG